MKYHTLEVIVENYKDASRDKILQHQKNYAQGLRIRSYRGKRDV
jgi:hypothetical protein